MTCSIALHSDLIVFIFSCWFCGLQYYWATFMPAFMQVIVDISSLVCKACFSAVKFDAYRAMNIYRFSLSVHKRRGGFTEQPFEHGDPLSDEVIFWTTVQNTFIAVKHESEVSNFLNIDYRLFELAKYYDYIKGVIWSLFSSLTIHQCLSCGPVMVTGLVDPNIFYMLATTHPRARARMVDASKKTTVREKVSSLRLTPRVPYLLDERPRISHSGSCCWEGV